MHELIAFFTRNSKWFVFAIYVVVSCMLLFNSDPYRHHLYLTSASGIASAVYKTSNNVTSYFNLRETNEDLNRRNAALEQEVVNLRQQLDQLQERQYTDTLVPDSGVQHFEFIVAHVINNSVVHPYNYLTINKGRLDGIQPEMGVINQNGVVGIVSVVGAHASRVISLLNPHFRLSCKIKGSDNFGSLVWDGAKPEIAMLEELPRHTKFQPGDTIVTSGYSAVFPPGLPVGAIIADGEKHKENFFALKIKLFSDFSALSNVQVILNNYRTELKNLEAGEDDDAKRLDIGS